MISKVQGWITVSPKSLDRKRPIEKNRLGDASKVNALSPTWMQVTHKKPDSDPLMPKGVQPGVVRDEANRTFLVEKDQPKRSIFNLGAFRHNVHSTELKDQWHHNAVNSGLVSDKP